MPADTVVNTGKRQRRDAELNRARILQAAREVFARQGLDATLHHIAEHARLGVGTVYRHFRNRDEILDELFSESLERLSLVGRDALDCDDAWTGFVQFLERSVEMMTSDRGLWMLAIGGASKSQHLARGREQYWSVVPQLIERAQSVGQLRIDLRPEDICVVSIMLGASAAFAGQESPDAWRRYLTLYLDGLRADRDPSPLATDQLSPAQLDPRDERLVPDAQLMASPSEAHDDAESVGRVYLGDQADHRCHLVVVPDGTPTLLTRHWQPAA